MALKTTKWDSAEYLETEEDRLGYMMACFEAAADDPAFITHAIADVARSRKMSKPASDTGFSCEGLYKALSEFGDPSFLTVWQVMSALGYSLKITPMESPLRGGCTLDVPAPEGTS